MDYAALLAKLRDYQQQAVASVVESWNSGKKAPLIVSPTGTGKTVMFAALAGYAIGQNKRALMLVDRTELVTQSQAAFQKWCGVFADIEQADMQASTSAHFAAPIVIATVQTLRSRGGDRKRRFKPEDFDYLIIDEAHLSITPSTIETVEYFQQNPNLKVVGATATPTRADKISLSALYDDCPFQYDIASATKDGWLVPAKAEIVHIDALHLESRGRKDWSDAQIGAYMENNDVVLATAQAVVDRDNELKTLVFCATVSHAKAVAARINQIEPNTAAVIHGDTPKHERKQTLREFEQGRIMRLINCGVLTTGFDSPSIERIVNARPTKSKSLFTQICGRGLRVLPNTVDGLDGPESRREAIEGSAKRYCKIVSLVGRESCHDLVGPVDVFAGDDVIPERLERAKELLEEGEVEDPQEALIMAEDEYEELMVKLEQAPMSVRLQYRVEEFDLYSDAEFRVAISRQADIPVEREVGFLLKAGFSRKEMRAWSGEQAKRAIELVKQRHEQGLATKKQCNLLAKFGYPPEKRATMTKKQANAIIGRKFKGKAS
jgi:superfamily II DNA or RNA helicase